MKKMKKGKAVAEAAEPSAMSETLHDDIMFNILSRLPVKSISRFRCVCKPWGKLFRSPNFMKMHVDRGFEDKKCKLMLIEDNIMYSSIGYCDPSLTCSDITLMDYPFKEQENSSIGVQIVGSCNGLLCIIPSPYSMEERICLWNPFTKEYKRLPIPEDQFFSDLVVDHVCIAYGFGYDCNIKDYKLVRIESFSNDEALNGCEVHVYTLLPEKWERIPDTYPYEICPPGVLVNGTLHWEAANYIGSTIIVSFDFGVERFKEILLPENLDDWMHMVVGNLGRSLCIFCQNIDDDSFVVWQMK